MTDAASSGSFSGSSSGAALPGLARTLIAAGLLSPAVAEQLYRQALTASSAPAAQRSLIATLVDSGAVAAHDVARTLSQALGLPLLDLDQVDDTPTLPPGPLDFATCQQHHIWVVGQHAQRLTVATADPTDAATLQKIQFACPQPIDWVVVEHDKLQRWLQNAPNPAAPARPAASTTANRPGDFEWGEATAAAPAMATLDKLSADVEDVPVVRFLQKMLQDAVRQRASDLHFEPYEHHYRVRFRIDGQLREIASPPLAIKDKLAARLKIISRLDIAEKRVPQDGRTQLKIGPDHVVDLRVSTLPTLFGEKLVVRILDTASAHMDIDAMGYEADDKAHLLAAIAQPHGMVLVTGPTGSGKTVSLYTCLNRLNQTGVNISTAEDPAEINLPGINQVNVNDKAGLSFASALRAFLRQDPDIIMVGEIRDLETADIAIKAAQTGHLVLSTLHTNDAPSTLTRLLHMGVAPFNIAASVRLITAQRLVRRLCPQCKQPWQATPPTLRQAGFAPPDVDAAQQGQWTPYQATATGCPACEHGYRGRIGIYQVMPVTEALQRIILRGGSAQEMAEQAQAQGVRSLRQAGLLKVQQGITSLDEVLSHTSAS